MGTGGKRVLMGLIGRAGCEQLWGGSYRKNWRAASAQVGISQGTGEEQEETWVVPRYPN